MNQFPDFQPGRGQFPGQFPGGQFPGQGPGQFPGQFPGQGPSFPPGFPPGQQQQGGAPTSAPPSFVPQRQQSVGVFAVDPGAIRGCLFRNTYVWLTNGRSFWFFPTFVGRNSVAGWRWNGRRWTYYGTDLNRIASFQCF
ncbi:transporter [Bacillus sp. Cr_A10]|uniref:transporter n=1 Tax=Bacillus sp. Cr_A10 TaxID=3033993 RepID=UPI0023DC73C9|nr:transporter [Bacillus sp. Cr_A10]MDF2068241.1 transporter [Bacillus sp. Cr_A10]